MRELTIRSVTAAIAAAAAVVIVVVVVRYGARPYVSRRRRTHRDLRSIGRTHACACVWGCD